MSPLELTRGSNIHRRTVKSNDGDKEEVDFTAENKGEFYV